MKNRTKTATRSACTKIIPICFRAAPSLLLRSAFTLVIILLTASCRGQSADSGNWRQWMGEDRKGIWHLDLNKESLDEGDMVKRWEVPIGTGYCGPTVFEGKVYVMDYVGEGTKSEQVLCFDLLTGELLWSHQYESSYAVGYPTGPRASVLIEDNRAYSLGTMGHLHCLDANTGKVIWQIDGERKYNISFPTWGIAASPVIEEELLIVQLGGTPGATVVALDKMTGKEVWRALSDEASYSPPFVIDQAGKRVLICWTGDRLAGMDPKSGEVYWSVPYERSKGVINIAAPVVEWPYLFMSSFYDGSMLVQLNEKSTAAELIWKRAGESERKTDALHCIMSTPFIKEGHVYGIDSYGEFRCLDMMTGDRIWTDSTLVPYGRWANAHFILERENIWAFNEKGELVLGRVSPEGFTDLGRVELVKPVRVSPNPRGGVNWACPAFSGRKVVARSDGMLVCWELVK